MEFLRNCLGILLVLSTLLALPVHSGDQDPDYPHGDFEDDCSLCHDSDSWTPVTISKEFDHSERGFPLQWAHARTGCRSCHSSLDFSRTQPACISCHMDIHRSELGVDCARCHTPRSFIDRSAMMRAHAATRFPLQGIHRTLDCEECHVPGLHGSLQFVGTPADCRDCHLDRYLQTTEPDHRDAGFPTDCSLCHSPTTWSRVRDGFNHDALFFPIFSGRHRGRWTECTDCHIGGNFEDFSCLQCHAHDDEAALTERHDEVSGFRYESGACYSCHPTGEE